MARSQSDCSPTTIVLDVPSVHVIMLVYAHGGSIGLGGMNGDTLLDAVSNSSILSKIRHAIYLLATSPEYITQK